jgi:hypothetical protein
MSTAMTFNSLQEDLRRYLERGFVEDTTVYDQLPRLINNAEREIAQDMKILGFIENLNSSLVINTPTYLKPNRWRSTVSMNFGVGTSNNKRVQLYPRSYEYCRQYWPDATATGIPKFYADYDFYHWLIVPTPVTTYPWELNIYQQPPFLDNVNQTNWLTDLASTTLLYRSLLECEPFLKNDSRIAVWREAYETSKASLDAQDLRRIADRNTSREKD